MMMILSNKKGMTLMELIVGMVMFSIISVSISMLLAPTLFAYMRANDFAEYNALLDNIANQIISDLSQSTDEPKFPPGGDWIEWRADDDSSFLTITTRTRLVRYTVGDLVFDTDNESLGGVLQRVGVNENDEPELFDVFSEDFYKRKAVSFSIEEATSNSGEDITAYTLTVRLISTGTMASTGRGFEVTRDYVVRPLMLNQS